LIDPPEDTVDYTSFVKKLVAPAGFAVPRELTYEDMRAIAITRGDLADDVAGIKARSS
jgi:hypothetical protein